MYFNLFLISLLMVFVLDLTDFYDNISSFFVRWLTKGKMEKPVYIKPFSCSLCMTWWTGLIYMICIGRFSVAAVAFLGLLSFLTPVFGDALLLIKDILTKIVNDIAEYFNINE